MPNDRQPPQPLELNDWLWSVNGPLENIFMHLGWAAHLVQRLPERIYDDTLPWEVRGACLQAFLVNARLMTEFFIKPSSKDFSAVELVPSWSPRPPELVERLRSGVWLVTSEYVVHLSKKRIADDGYEPAEFDTSLKGLSQIRDDLMELWEAWDEELPELRRSHPLAGWYLDAPEEYKDEDDN